MGHSVVLVLDPIHFHCTDKTNIKYLLLCSAEERHAVKTVISIFFVSEWTIWL